MSNLTQNSLALMSTLFPSSFVWIGSGVVNLILSSLCFTVFYKSPIFGHTATYTIIRWLLVNDICSSTYFILLHIWHIKNYLTHNAEFMPIDQCYKIIAIQTVFYYNNLAFNLLLSVQRLCGILKPKDKFYRSFRFGIALCICALTIGLAVFLCNVLLDTFPGTVLYCTARTSSGKIFSQIRVNLMAGFSAMIISSIVWHPGPTTPQKV